MEWIAAEVSAPLVLDPVSVAKVPRARGLVGRLAVLKCNAAEAAALLGMGELRSEAQVVYAAKKLVATGARSVFITAGGSGVHFASADESGWLPPPAIEVVNATGAGDAFSAGVTAAMLEGMGVRDCARFGSALAGIALASTLTVSEGVSRDAVAALMEAMAG